MARRRVIAYPMNEAESAEVGSRLDAVERTEAFAVGFLDDAELKDLRIRGIFIEEVDDVGGATTASTARRALGLLPDAPLFEPAPAEPGESVNWRVSLEMPLVERLREAITASGGEVVEALSRFEYLVVGTTDTADALIATSGVVEVSRHGGGGEIGPVALRAGAAGGVAADGGAAGPLGWDVIAASPQWAQAAAQWLTLREIDTIEVSSRVLRVQLARDDATLVELAHRPGVLQVVEYVEPELQLDHALVLVGLPADRTGTGRFDGTGQIVAVADSGVDDTHPDLVDRIVGSEALGRPGRDGARGSTSDPSGHGTHVAGVVAGTGVASGGAYRGVAPGAQLFVQSLYGGPGKAQMAGLPPDVGSLLQSAYTAGARVHNNSWGGVVNAAYNAWGLQIDEFVEQHQDLVVIIAAGNEGSAASPMISPPGYPDQYSVTAPGTAKNAITVGASRSTRKTVETHRDRWPELFRLSCWFRGSIQTA